MFTKMHAVCSDIAARCVGLILIVLTTATIIDVAAMPNDEFLPNSKCQLGEQQRPLRPLALHENSTELDILLENTVCTGRQDLVLQCVPRSPSGKHVIWKYWTQTARCRSDGSRTGGNYSLRLPCGSYSVQCLRVNSQNQVIARSPVIHITKDYEIQEKPHYCMEGEFNFVTFFCQAPVDEVMSTRWFVGGKEYTTKIVSKDDDLRLDLPCTLKNHKKNVSCEVEFSGGIVNKTLGWIQVDKSNSINGPPTTIVTPEPDTEKTSQCPSMAVGIAIAIIITVLVTLVPTIIITFLITRICTSKKNGMKVLHESDESEH